MKYRGTGKVTTADFKKVKYVGKTKGGKPITIEFEKAINMGNIDWAFAEKNDVVSEVTFTAVYKNTDTMAEDTTEPWIVDADEQTKGAAEIILGVGIFEIDDVKVGLTRGGGKFSVQREYREINADGDRGPVEGRIEMTGSRATLTMNVLQILTNMKALYGSIETVEAQTLQK